MKHVEDMLANGSKCRWGNYHSVVHFPLSISLEADPLVHLTKTKSVMDRNKHSLVASVLYSNQELIIKIFGHKVCNEISERSSKLFGCFHCEGTLCDTHATVGSSGIIQAITVEHNDILFKHRWPRGRSKFTRQSHRLHRSKLLWKLTSMCSLFSSSK